MAGASRARDDNEEVGGGSFFAVRLCKRMKTAVSMKKALNYAKEYSAILADDLTKSVGHTLSDGMQECLTYIIAEDVDGTYKPLTFRCCHYHNQNML